MSGRLRLLLASSSVAALLIGGSAPAAFAAPCKIVQNGGTIASVSNSSATGNCILVEGGASVSGNVSNTSTGVLTTNGAASPSKTGITITNSTVTGTVSNAGTITAQQSGIVVNDNAIVSGGISNSGTISVGVVGDGVVVGVPTFSGGITNSGTIGGGVVGVFVNDAATFTGNIINTGTIRGGDNGIFVNLATSFVGSISNGGTISTGGEGINVSGISLFSGGITNGATISAGGTGISLLGFSTFNGGISNGGTIIAHGTGFQNGIAVSDVGHFFGGISNSGVISAAGTGISIGGGVTFGAGGAIVNTGTIIGTTAAIDVSSATSPVTINQNGGLISGLIRLSTNADVLNISGGTINGDIAGAGSSDTINFNLGSGTFTYANLYGFATINQVNVNSGTVILDGESNATTVNVKAGTLQIGDAANTGALLLATNAVDVTGGTLSGHGTIEGPVTIASGGTLFPGGSIGTLTISGSLTFNSGSTYGIELTPTQHSMTVVNGAPGTVTINGGTVALTSHFGTYAPSTFAIITSTGTLTGQFNPTVAFTGSFHLNDAALSYDAHDVYLSYAQTFATIVLPPGATINQINVSTGINNFILGGGTPPAPFQTLAGLSGTALLTALNQIDGEDATGAQVGAFQLDDEFLNLMLNPFVNGRGYAPGGAGGGPLGFTAEQQASLPDDVALAYAAVLGKAPPKASFDQRWSVWGAGYGGSNTSNGDPAVVGSSNITASTYGYAGGMDYHAAPNTVVGFALSGGGTNWDLANALGTGRSDAFQAGAYGITWYGPAYLAGALAFGNYWFTTDRTAFAGDQLTAKFVGQSYSARFEGGYRYAVLPTFGVTPYAAVEAQDFHTPSYSETDLTGGGFGLSYNALSATDVRTELGARFDAPMLAYGQPLVLYGRLAWAHDFVSDPALNATFELLPGSGFTVFGAPIPHDSALTTAGAQLFLAPNWSLIGTFNGQFADGSQIYAGSGTLRYTW